MAEITIRLSDGVLRTTGAAVGGIFLALVFFFLWSSSIFIPKYRLRVYVPELSGLNAQTQVKLDGVLIGSVTAIHLATESASPERSVELVLRVDKRYQEAIRSDSTATAVVDGLLGPRYVSIRRGFQGSAVQPDGEIQFVPAQEISLKDVLKSVEKTGNCFQADKNSADDKSHPPSEALSKPRH